MTLTDGVIRPDVWAVYLATFDVYDRAFIRVQQGTGETMRARDVLELSDDD